MYLLDIQYKVVSRRISLPLRGSRLASMAIARKKKMIENKKRMVL